MLLMLTLCSECVMDAKVVIVFCSCFAYNADRDADVVIVLISLVVINVVDV